MTEPTTPAPDAQQPTTESQTTEKQTPATPVAEPKKEEAPAAPKPELTSRLARLAREQAAIENQKRELEEARKQFDSEKLTMKEKMDLLESLPQRIRENPDEVLEKLGISYQEITKSILESDDPTAKELRGLQSELKKIKEEREAEKKALEEKQLQLQEVEQQKIIDDYRSGVNKYIDENPEKYELIKSAGLQDQVWDVIIRHFDEKKELLSAEQAADWVETFLEKEQLEKLVSTKKLTRLFEGRRSSGDKTLSSSMTSTNVETKEELSDDERFKKAVSILKTKG